jgi:hypothetical protein
MAPEHVLGQLLETVRRFRAVGSLQPGVFNPHREAFRQAVQQLGELGVEEALPELSPLLEMLPRTQLATDSISDFNEWAGDIPDRQPETFDSSFFEYLQIPNPDYEAVQAAILRIQARSR